MDYNELKDRMSKQKVYLTPKERMQKYMAGEKVDFLPYNMLTSEFIVANILGYTTEQYNNDFEVFAEVIEYKIKRFGLDGINISLGLRGVGAALGSKRYFPENGIDHVEDFIIKDYSQIDEMKVPDPYNNPVFTPLLKRAIKAKERFPDVAVTTGISGAITNASGAREIEDILKDTRKNKDNLKKLLDLCLETSIRWVEVFTKEIGKGPVSISDPVSTTDILAPRQYQELSLSYMKEQIKELINITGAKPSLHICGRTKGIWQYLRELNLSSFSVDNVEDLGECSETFGDKMLVVGNVPPVEVMRLGTIDEVIESVRSCICKAGASKNGYMVATGCALALGTPIENLDAFIYAVREYGAGAIKGKMPEGIRNSLE